MKKLTVGKYEHTGKKFEITRLTEKTAWVSIEGMRERRRKISQCGGNQSVKWDDFRTLFPSNKLEEVE